MQSADIDLLWLIFIGTVVALLLGFGLISAMIVYQRERLRFVREKSMILEEGERRYSALFNNVSDIVYVHAMDGTILQVNQTIRQYLGMEAEALIGRSIEMFLKPMFRPYVASYLASFSLERPAVNGVVPVVSAGNGSIYLFEYHSTAVIEDGRTVAVRGIARDVTHRIKNERFLARSERRMKRMLEESRAMQERLATLSREIIRIQEEDRHKISRELHDEVGQILATVGVNLQVIRKNLARKSAVVTKTIDDTQALVGNLFDHVHRFLSELRPIVLDKLGLIPAIRRYVTDYSPRTGLRIAFTEDPSVEKLDSEQKVALYRVIQESLANVAKHAHAEHVDVTMARIGDDIVTEIRDDGRGMDFSMDSLHTVRPRDCLGLLGMQERVKLARGELKITSEKGKGTSVQIRIPLPIVPDRSHSRT